MVVLDVKSLTVKTSFRSYVRPRFKPHLTTFCTSLTGITQETVNEAETFDGKEGTDETRTSEEKKDGSRGKKGVWSQVVDFLSSQLHVPLSDLAVKYQGASPPQPTPTPTPSQPRWAFVTCGDWDLKTMLKEQFKLCDWSYPPPTPFCRWINIKRIFEAHQKIPARGMPDMLSALQLPLVGRHHSGLDDCHNIVAICVQLIKLGAPFYITTSIGERVRKPKKVAPNKPKSKKAPKPLS